MLLSTLLAGLALVCYQTEASHCPPAPRNSLTGHKRTPHEMLCDPCDQLFDPDSSFMKECGDFLTTFTINKLTTSCQNVHEDEIDKFIQNLQILCQYKGYGPFDEPDEEDCGCDLCDLLFDPNSDFMKKCAFDFDDWTKDALRYKCDKADCGTHGLIKLEKYLSHYCSSRGRKFRFPSCECDECLMLFRADSEFMTNCGTSMSEETLDKLFETCSLCMDNVDALFTFLQTLKTMCVWKGFDPFSLPFCDCSDFCWHFFDPARTFYEDCFSELPFSRRLKLFKECRSVHQDPVLAQDFIDDLEQECYDTTGVTAIVPTDCQNCTDRQFDIVLVVDISYSISAAQMATQKTFLIALVNSFTVADDFTRIGIVTFGSTGAIEQTLEIGNTMGAVEDVININIQRCPCSTNTPDGIRKMIELFDGSDVGSQRMGVVVTDGRSNDGGSLPDAINLIPSDVTMFAVGVAGADQAELIQIADGNSDHVKTVNDFDELSGIIEDLRDELCD